MRAVIITLLLFLNSGYSASSASPSDGPPVTRHQGAPANQATGHPLQDTHSTSGADDTPASSPGSAGSGLSGVPEPVAVGTATVAPQSEVQVLSSAAPEAAAVTPGECGPDLPTDTLLGDVNTCRADELGLALTARNISASSDSKAPADTAQQQDVGEAAATATSGAAAAAAAMAEPLAEEPEDTEERHNFASGKDGAKIVAANKEARKPGSLLDNDGDTFVKNECKAEKWVIIELGQVVNIDTLKVSQYELYSSRVREFQVRVRTSHPRSDGDYGKNLESPAWKLLGNFTAQRVKGTQVFKVEPGPWAKYLQIRFLSQYGSEPVCAVNDIMVHGKSAAQDLEDQLAAGDDAAHHLPPPAAGEPPDAKPAAATPPSAASGGAVAGGAVALEGLTGGGSLGDAPEPGGGVAAVGLAAAAVAPETDSGLADPSLPMPGPVKSPVDSGGVAVLGVVGGSGAPLQDTPRTEDATSPQLASVVGSSGAVAGTEAVGQPVPTAAPSPAAAAAVGGAVSGHGSKPAVVQEELLLRPPATDDGTASGKFPADFLAAAAAAAAAPPALPPPSGGADRAPAASADGPQLLKSHVGSGRAGGSVYDMLVQELKSIKVQQKAMPRQLAELQRNATAAAAAASAAAADLAAFRARLAAAEAALVGLVSDEPAIDADRLRASESALHALERRLAAAEKREMAMLGAVAMLAGLTARSALQPNGKRSLFSSAVVVLSLANGCVGLLLYCNVPAWVQHIRLQLRTVSLPSGR